MTQTVLLGDVVDISSSKRIFYSEYTDEGVPFYRSKEIIEKAAGNPVSTPLHISNERFIEISEKFGAPKAGDILLTSVGTLGIPYLVQEDDHFYFKDGNLTWFRKYSDSLLPEYLYYWLSSPVGKAELENHTIGSTQRALTIQGLKKVRIPLLPTREQREVVRILESINHKIEVNGRMNETLEQIGQTLFKHYFIDNPESKTWPVTELGNYIELVNGASYKSSELKPSANALVTLKSFSRGGGFRRDGFKEFIGTIKDPQVVTDGDIVVAHTDVTQKAEIAGVPALVTGTGRYEKVGISMDVVKVNSTDDNISSAFLYFLLRSRTFQDHKMGYISGTTVLHLNKKCIPSYKLRIPTDSSVLKAISDSFVSIVKSIAQNEDQADSLTELRYSLLPRLMSGKIKV